jgi:protein TonB
MEILEDTAHPQARLRQFRMLTLCVAASLAVHAALLLGLPDFRPRAAGHVEVLEVMLAKQEPPRVLEAARPALREQPREERKKPARETTSSTPPPVETAPREILALPAKPSESEPVFTVPQLPVETPRAETSPRRDVAKGAPAADGAAPEPKTTPPIFNAAYLGNADPTYPLSSRRRGEHGTVLLKVQVTRQGAAGSVSVERTSGFEALDRAALEAVRAWRFAPARQGTQPVEAWVLVPVVFKLEG